MSQHEALYLADIVESATKIAAYLKNVSLDQFNGDEMRQDAVIRQLAIIGEAASSVSDTTRSSCPSIPWRLIRGMRNMLVHEYFGIDLDIVYNSATRDVPGVAERVTALLTERYSDVALRFQVPGPNDD